VTSLAGAGTSRDIRPVIIHAPKAGLGFNSNWGARPSRLRGRSHCVAAKARSPLATSRREHSSAKAFGGTPTIARGTHALPIIKRPPLSPTARRAGGIGCNFDLNRIPAEARIPVVITVSSLPQSSAAVPAASLNLPIGRRDACATFIVQPEEVREKFRRVKPLKEISVTQSRKRPLAMSIGVRDWTSDVLNVVSAVCDRRKSSGSHRAPRNPEGRAPRDPNFPGQSGTRITRPSDSFTTTDVYAFESELEKLHPG
jgi:hypothetical protein